LTRVSPRHPFHHAFDGKEGLDRAFPPTRFSKEAKTFTGPQIRLVAVPDLGTLASVTLHVTPIAEITFTVLLPTVVLDPPIEPVHTDGITTHHLLFPPFGQKEFYTVTPLNGSASL